MENPFRVKCNMCDKEDDLRMMRRFEGKFYHVKKIRGNRTSCLQAVKDTK